MNRLDVAFEEVGPDTTLKSVIAFLLLKQSGGQEGFHHDKWSLREVSRIQCYKLVNERAGRPDGGTQEGVTPEFCKSHQRQSNQTNLTWTSFFAAQSEEDDLSSEQLEQLAKSTQMH